MARTLWWNFSAPAQEREHDLNTTQHPIVINENPPKHTEIFKAIKQIKKKAAGPDGISHEIFMACTNTMAKLLAPLIKTTWEIERFPDDWKKG